MLAAQEMEVCNCMNGMALKHGCINHPANSARQLGLGTSANLTLVVGGAIG